MRDWDSKKDSVDAAGARLVVLSPDAPGVLREAIRAKGLKADFAAVDEELWARWGLANPKRPRLPHPTTLVIARDGRLVLRETHVNYRERADAASVLAAIAAHRASGELVEEQGPPAPEELDWDGALTVRAARSGATVTLTLEVAPGFHVYGTKEETGRPLAVRVDGDPGAATPIPEGNRKDLDGLGASWVLDGTVTLAVTLSKDGPATGDLDVQLCTESLCSRPQTRRWSAP